MTNMPNPIIPFSQEIIKILDIYEKKKAEEENSKNRKVMPASKAVQPIYLPSNLCYMTESHEIKFSDLYLSKVFVYCNDKEIPIAFFTDKLKPTPNLFVNKQLEYLI